MQLANFHYFTGGQLFYFTSQQSLFYWSTKCNLLTNYVHFSCQLPSLDRSLFTYRKYSQHFSMKRQSVTIIFPPLLHIMNSQCIKSINLRGSFNHVFLTNMCYAVTSWHMKHIRALNPKIKYTIHSTILCVCVFVCAWLMMKSARTLYRLKLKNSYNKMKM